ncbi:hypothetical protein Sango_2843800 [Sesamum angolense]|uniref:Uncharacterized protein n=1 Tax=Sesamum angolense TaxID=2727404 RepID=A0AAE1T6C5_9LAMI|nr:hypothetical protein Sango_2843800 [Sesamum angolense]
MSPLLASLIPSIATAPAAAQLPLKSPNSPISILPPLVPRNQHILTAKCSRFALVNHHSPSPFSPPTAPRYRVVIRHLTKGMAERAKEEVRQVSLSSVKSEAEFGENDLGEVQKLLVSAARDCVPQDRNSFVEFQANTGVEVTIIVICFNFVWSAFRLIVKNASSLLDDKDPIKLEAEAKLSDLIRYAFGKVGFNLLQTAERAAGALKDTISSLNNFEQVIKDCLQV